MIEVNESPRVLIVDNERARYERYTTWLNDTYTVKVATECDHAYWSFVDPIDVMVIDSNLPDGSGDELITTIREFGFDVHVVLMAAEEPRLDMLEIDFDDYLCKPVSEEELHSTIARLVDQRTFRDAITAYNRLTTKKALIVTHCVADDPTTSAEYIALEERLEEIRKVLHESSQSHPEVPRGVNAKSVLSN